MHCWERIQKVFCVSCPASQIFRSPDQGRAGEGQKPGSSQIAVSFPSHENARFASSVLSRCDRNDRPVHHKDRDLRRRRESGGKSAAVTLVGANGMYSGRLSAQSAGAASMRAATDRSLGGAWLVWRTAREGDACRLQTKSLRGRWRLI